jgi:DUF1009 family protein
MKEIISGQTVVCDIHEAGTGRAAIWGKGLHIHKRMNGKEYGRAEIRIPLDSESDMEIVTRGNQEIKKRLVNEIRRAFEDKQKRREFVKGLIQEIERFSDNMHKEENLRAAAKRIAKHFDLDDKISREIIERINDHIVSITTIHDGNDLKQYYITQEEDKIQAGEFRYYKRIANNKKYIRD